MAELKDIRMSGVQLQRILDDYKNSSSFLKYSNNQYYYEGKNPKIINTVADRESKNINPNNLTPLPFARRTVNDVVGYAYKPGKVNYIFEDEDETIQDLFDLNMQSITSSEEFQDALIKGEAAELMWYDGQNIRFAQIPREECYFQYKNIITKELDYSIRFYKQTKTTQTGDNETTHYAQVYYSDRVDFYEWDESATDQQEQKTINTTKDEDITTYVYKDSETHSFGSPPLYPMSINSDNIGVFEPAISLIDIMDDFSSESIGNAIQRFNETLLLLSKRIDEVDPTLLKDIKIFDDLGENGRVEFLNRDLEITSTVQAFELYERLYYELTGVPRLSDETFNTQSGIAIQYKLVPFENLVSQYEVYFTRSLLHRLDLINNARQTLDNIPPVKATLKWERNLPFDIQGQLNIIKTAKESSLPISDETLLRWIPEPYIKDAVLEIEKYNEEQEDKGVTQEQAIKKAMSEMRLKDDDVEDEDDGV